MPRTSPAPRQAGNFAPDDWRLLIRLPAEIMVVAVTAQDSGPRRTVAEGLAGLDAIAAGRGSDSELVRAVVREIYCEQEDPRPGDGDGDGGGSRIDLAQVLDRCRRAAEVLRTAADPVDATAYRAWVQQVAAGVSGASRSGGVLNLGGEAIAAPQRELLDDLAAALS